MNKKEILTYLILGAIILSIVLIIFVIKNGNSLNKELAQCIGQNSELYVKEGCSACRAQKNVLESYLDNFNIINCAYEPQKCAESEIMRVPSWIINEKIHEGVYSIKKLKQLTGC